MLYPKSNNLTHFSNHKSCKIVFNNFDRFFYSVWIIILVFTYQDLLAFQKGVVIELSILIILILFTFSRLLKKVVHEITIDWDTNQIHFVLYKTSNPITVGFGELKSITINGSIYFNIGGKTKLFSNTQYTELLPELNKIQKIQWGKYCDLLGPSKEIRERVISIIENRI